MEENVANSELARQILDKIEELGSPDADIKKIMVIGGCRAYLDAFSDYMNPLLIEMDKAEKMLSNMNVKK